MVRTYLSVSKPFNSRGSRLLLTRFHLKLKGITVINHPFPKTQSYFSYDEILQGNDALIAIFIIVAMSFVPASFVLYLVYETSNKSKHLQLICGVHRVVYWVANYVWDIVSSFEALETSLEAQSVICFFYSYSYSSAATLFLLPSVLGSY
jgi:hypothetical protein